MSIVTDRRCDGCGAIREQQDEAWVAVIPPRWDGIDYRLDFCDARCLRDWAKQHLAKLEDALSPAPNTGKERGA